MPKQFTKLQVPGEPAHLAVPIGHDGKLSSQLVVILGKRAFACLARFKREA